MQPCPPEGQGYCSSSSTPPSTTVSLVSRTGDEITYSPLAHFARSRRRQRELQKGNSGSELFTAFLQIGQRRRMARLRAIRDLRISSLQVLRCGLLDHSRGIR